MLKFLLLTHLAFSAEVVTMSVAKVEKDIISSRDVLISHYISQSLGSKKLEEPALKSEAFRTALSATILEAVVYKEAKALETSFVSASEVNSQLQRIQSKLQGSKLWKKLEVTPQELKQNLNQKLKAQAFIQFKANSSIIPITDTEALNYFNANQSRFSGLEFEAFKEQIKKYLSKQQMDQRLKSWFQTLREKYSVNNMLGEWQQ